MFFRWKEAWGVSAEKTRGAEAMETASESTKLGGSERPDFALTELNAGDRMAASVSGGEAKLLVVGVLSSFDDSGESTSSIDRVRGGTSTI